MFDYGKTCKSVSYLEVGERGLRIIVESYLKANVPELNTFCPEDWGFDSYTLMDPLMNYLLGGNLKDRVDPYFVREHECLYLYDNQLSCDGQLWMLKITIAHYSSPYEEVDVLVPIPYSLLQNIKDALFKDHNLIKIQ